MNVSSGLSVRVPAVEAARPTPAGSPSRIAGVQINLTGISCTSTTFQESGAGEVGDAVRQVLRRRVRREIVRGRRRLHTDNPRLAADHFSALTVLLA
ncbi:hypothetical protein ACWDDN_43575 [Streptomyces griseoruber]